MSLHDALDDDRRVLVPRLSKSSVSAALPRVFVCDRLGGVLGGDDVAGEVEERLQELDADEQPLLVPLLEFLEPLARAP